MKSSYPGNNEMECWKFSEVSEEAASKQSSIYYLLHAVILLGLQEECIMFLFHWTTRLYNIPDDGILHNYRRKNSDPPHSKPALVSRRQYKHCFERKHLDFCIQYVWSRIVHLRT